METMTKEKRSRRSFSDEFKAEAVGLVRDSGLSVAQVARDLDLTESSLRNWVRQAEIDDGTTPGLMSDEKAELARLRAENTATAFFAKETR